MHAFQAPPAPAVLRRVPRRISLGFAHSAAAAGFWRRHVVRSVDLKQNDGSDGRKSFVRSVDLEQHVCIYAEIQRICVLWETYARCGGRQARRTKLFGERPGTIENTYIYCGNCIFHVFRRESKAELASLSRCRLANNIGSRKSLRNPTGIQYFVVFEVANASTF